MTAAEFEFDRTIARARALGIDVLPGDLTKPFRCVLPRHDHPARLRFRAPFWLYRCPEVKRLIELAEVRAAIGYGYVRSISELERVRWRELLDFEAGSQERGPAPIPLPPDAPESTLRVGEAWRLHVGLRDPDFWRPGEPFVFARPYVMARARVTDTEARNGVRDLEEYGSMIRIGIDRRTRAILWLPGPTYYLMYGDEQVAVEKIIEALKGAFGAVEL